MTIAERQIIIQYQQLFLLRFFYIVRLYQIHKSLGLRNSTGDFLLYIIFAPQTKENYRLWQN